MSNNAARFRNIGLRNLGNTCFLNSILQSLASLPSFAKYIDCFQNFGTQPFSAELSNCLKALQLNDKCTKKYDTTKLLARIKKYNQEFSGYEQQDAQELLQIVLSIVSDEFRSSSSNPIQHLLKLENKAHVDFIRNPFEGLISSHIECHDCISAKPVRHQTFLDLSLSIPSLPNANLSLLRSNADRSSFSIISARSIHSAIHRIGHPVINSISSSNDDTSNLSSKYGPQDLTLEHCLEHFIRYELVSGVECPTCSRTQFLKQNSETRQNCCKGNGGECYSPTATVSNSSNSFNTLTEKISVDHNSKLGSDGECTTADLSVSPCESVSTNDDDSSWPMVRTLAWKTMRLSRLPDVLCLHLQRRVQRIDRGFGSSPSKPGNISVQMVKLTTRVCISPRLDLSRFLDRELYPMGAGGGGGGGGGLYELKAVVEHAGSADAGHYLCYRRVVDAASSRWLRVSDCSVDPVSEDAVLRCQAYLLFYERDSR